LSVGSHVNVAYGIDAHCNIVIVNDFFWMLS